MSETLLADIGGTHARFALLVDDTIGPVETIDVAAVDGLEAVVSAFLERVGATPREALFAVAGPVESGRLRLTNSGWIVDARALERKFEFARLHLVNDFAAIAWALPRLDPAAMRQIGGGAPEPAAPAVVVGPGTGFGVAAYLPDAGGRVIAGEGGHVTLAAANEREDRIVSELRARFGHASAERAVSGPGLVNLYRAISALDGVVTPQRTPEQITEAACADACPVCREALSTFCTMLGTIAGDLALTLGARRGVHVVGGIVPRILDFLSASDFRARFEAKGRFSGYLARIPTHVILLPHPAFLGLAELVSRQGR